jgi:hypothetical protein
MSFFSRFCSLLPFICLKSFGSHAWLFPCLCVLTLKSLSLILGFSLDLSLVTIKFWLLNTLSKQLQVWSGKVSAYWANLIISGTSFLWNRVIVFQRDGILSTGYFADLTIVFTKLRWKNQSTHVLKKYQFMLTNKQTNALLSSKTPTMSSIINKKITIYNWFT